MVEVEVRWAGSDTVQRYSDLQLDRCYQLREGAPEATAVTLPRLTFEASSEHQHQPKHD